MEKKRCQVREYTRHFHLQPFFSKTLKKPNRFLHCILYHLEKHYSRNRFKLPHCVGGLYAKQRGTAGIRCSHLFPLKARKPRNMHKKMKIPKQLDYIISKKIRSFRDSSRKFVKEFV